MAGKYWREAASLMLVIRNGISRTSSDFKVLMMKRSSKSKFMPNACVFPGGVVDSADFHNDWLHLLEDHNVDSLPQWTSQSQRPMIYEAKQNEAVRREIAFRINAIRETFEETGIFLSHGGQTSHSVSLNWRSRVHSDPNEFLKMCRELGACPDVWALSEWSDWLTPLHLVNSKARYDTMFYVAFKDDFNESHATEDGDKEVSEVQFLSPSTALQLHSDKKIWLAPPQVYELSRLASFTDCKELKTFAKQRTTEKGVVTWLPIIAICSDGQVSLYPGDDLYPANPDFKGTKTDKLVYEGISIEELASKTVRRNRMEMRGLYRSKINCNVQDPCGHPHPTI